MFVPELQAHGFNSLDFSVSGLDGSGSQFDYSELAGAGFFVDGVVLEIDGTLDEAGTRKVTVRHRSGGKIVGMCDLMARQGDFSCSFELRRGLNELDFVIDDDEENALRLNLVCKSGKREWIENLVKALVLVILVKTFIVQAFFIPTGSMEDTLFPGDYILVDKLSYLFEKPKRNDIIVFQYPLNFTQDFIKRLIGLPGDELYMRNKQLYRNGKKLVEPWAVHKDFRRYIIGEWAIRDNWEALTVPDNAYFVMGDNRDYSQDSRFWGTLPAYRLKGKAFLIYYPFRRFGLIRHGEHETTGP